jgi:hypothetical protein
MKRAQKTKEEPTIDEDVEKRIVPRISTDLPTIVQVKVSEEETWKEMTNITTVSRTGAGFSSTRQFPIGSLIRLIIPMPNELRAYDRSEEFYPIMGVVQHCNKESDLGEITYHVGVALIGRHSPDSYATNPQQNYRISGMSEDGLWNITEASAPHKERRHARFSAHLNVTLTLLEKDKRQVTKENTVTRNVGLSGASVVCNLDAKAGDTVKFGCKELNYYTMATVRDRRRMSKVTTLHLEFADSNFPIHKLPGQDQFYGDIETPAAEPDQKSEMVDENVQELVANEG